MSDDDCFYLVWKDGGGAPSYRHPDVRSAKAEADRLARTVGGRFYVLCATSFTERNETRTVELRQDLPF